MPLGAVDMVVCIGILVVSVSGAVISVGLASVSLGEWSSFFGCDVV